MQMASNTPAAITKRKAQNNIGGKSARPILIASQVELQIRQSAIQAAATASVFLAAGNEARVMPIVFRGRVAG
jgi:hypothetical protein